jgi:hypothetical protein
MSSKEKVVEVSHGRKDEVPSYVEERLEEKVVSER